MRGGDGNVRNMGNVISLRRIYSCFVNLHGYPQQKEITASANQAKSGYFL
jgi:hypothetical protein